MSDITEWREDSPVYNLPLTESICNCEEFLHSVCLQLVFSKLKLLYTIR